MRVGCSRLTKKSLTVISPLPPNSHTISPLTAYGGPKKSKIHQLTLDFPKKNIFTETPLTHHYKPTADPFLHHFTTSQQITPSIVHHLNPYHQVTPCDMLLSPRNPLPYISIAPSHN